MLNKKIVSLCLVSILLLINSTPSINSNEINNDSEGSLQYKEYYLGATYDPDICYYVPGQVIVGFEGYVDISDKTEVEGYPIYDWDSYINVVYVEDVDVDLFAFIDMLNARDDVKYSELNQVVFGCDFIPNDQKWGEQWGHIMINCHKAWETTTGKDVKIAVLDSGIDDDHEDFGCPDKIP